MNGRAGRILLLMKEPEANFFSEILLRANRHLAAEHTDNIGRLRAAVARPAGGPTRLIAFSTQIIAPPDVLRAIAYNAYNFHPGPPNYPGSKPSAFAVLGGASQFGVTLHRMADRVDSGPIVTTRLFPVTPDAHARDLATEAYGTMARLALELAAELAAVDRPLPESGARWAGPTRRMAEYEALRRIPPGLDQEETARRFRACEGIYSIVPSVPSPADDMDGG
ncbi:hypothetical protein KAJ83_03700 [Marivibrio halodurans]|uniref:Formyl transferase N-terminal domain-containing protein n=1 Tax=Marivibrio halodurans TaxID=2039722 RepID=A0A8J7V2T4_9PROT|nr:formyltransferase family protein [Marivibrio halodurans]MBP5856099.1 hypothetical protein [Marivibrio halodurans]